jgi:hypothetical protein
MLAAICVASVDKAQERGTQLTPPQDLVLVNKDVGDQRWAIALDLRTGTATGNVFRRNGGPTSFIWCSATKVELAADPKETNYTLDCWGADACPSPPCAIDSWSRIPESPVDLPGSFLFSP